MSALSFEPPRPLVAGPTPQGSSVPNVADLKRRADAELEARRPKQQRPPLPPPHILASLVPDSPAFLDLLKVEQKLDWTLLRKKAEINDAMGKPIRVKRALRVFVSNTAHDQQWQKETNEAGPSSGPEAVDMDSGKGIAGWVLRIEGRLLDSGNARLDKTRRKFSTFVRSAIVELDNREAPTFPEGNIVEWHPQGLQAPLDGFEVSRRGDQDVNCRIVLHVNHYPEKFRILPPLAEIIAMKEGTRAEAMSAVWKLVKVLGAQDKDDGSILKRVGDLEKILPANVDSIPFHQLPEHVTRFLSHPEPVIIPYTIRVDRDFHFHQKCFDIPIELEDPVKSKMSSLLTSFDGEEGKEIVKLEDKVAEMLYFTRDLKQKRDFLESFSTNPQAFIQNWLAVQARDLDQMLGYQIGAGPNGGSVTEEDLRRSDMFTLPWVDEAITVHEASRMEQERRRM
ncbi:putative chromatin remodeling-related protein [Dioszegia hungarica]|uniref:Chromatin remodeling-related protein n=1 Tax=Dioszegia hungarica TaxID=4972 RepID=A0AA38LXQ6_9TREE|nr:putative chromatin remodeling-related protein [Dioszegia hungarica]KAI9638968.1 putative chromatin remodeling-related protein [Dioszegia hungarica]